MSSVAIETRPYIGLRYFEERDAHFFYGRDEHVSELLGKVALNRFVAVMGSSGSGKSSLVRAGLLPELRSGMIPKAGPRWKVVEFKPGRAPLDELSRAIRSELGVEGARELVEEGPLGIARAVAEARLDDGRNVLLIADQFEEIFRFQREESGQGRGAQAAEQCQALVRRLLDAAAQPELSIYVLLVMRSDYLGECAQFPELPERMSESLYLVPRLRRDQLQEAITAPVGGAIEPAVVQRLLGEVGSDPDQLPRLQHLLGRMWDRASAGRLTMDHFTGAGGWEKGLEQHLEEAYGHLSAAQQAVCGRIFQQLSELDKGRAVRRRAETAELLEVCGPVSTDVVGAFRSEGFVSSRENPVDITHECILREWPRLREWLEREDLNAKRLRELAEAAKDAGWRPGLTSEQEEPVRGLAGLTLQNLTGWRNEVSPTAAWARRYLTAVDFETANGYLTWSETRDKEQKKRVRQRTRLLLGLLVVLLLGLGLISWEFYQQKREAERQSGIAETRRITAENLKTEADNQRTTAENLKTEADNQRTTALGLKTEAENQKGIAEDRARIARSLQLAAQASLVRKDQLDLSLLLSWESYTVAQTNEAKGAVLAGLVESGRLLKILRNHDAAVESAVFHPTGRLFATGASDGGVILWDLPSGRPLGPPLPGHHSAVNCMAFAADGASLAAGGEDGAVILWDLGTRQSTVLRKSTPKESVKVLGFRPDNKSIWIGTSDGSLSVFDWNSRQWRATKAPVPEKARLAFSADGTHSVWRDGRGSLVLWDFDTGIVRPVAQGLKATDSLSPIAVSPNGTTVAAVTEGAVKMWDTSKANSAERPMYSSPTYFQELSFSPDGQILAARTYNSIQLWGIGGDYQRAVNVKYSTAIAFSPDAKTMASGGCGNVEVFKECTLGEVRLWDLENPLPIAGRLAGHEAAVTRVSFHPNGATVASADQEGRILVRNILTGETLADVKVGGEPVYSLTFSLSGDLLAAGDASGTVIIFDTRKHYGTTKLVVPGGGDVCAIRFTRDGQRLVAASFNNPTEGHLSITWWDVARKQLLGRPIQGPVAWPEKRFRLHSVEFSPDASFLAAAYLDPEKPGRELGPTNLSAARNRVTLYETSGGMALHTVTGSSIFAPVVGFSDEGKMLVVGSTGPNADATLTLLDVGTFRQLGLITGEKTGLMDLAVEGGTTIFAGGGSVTEMLGSHGISIWDIQTGERQGPTLPGGSTSVAWSRTRRALISGDRDGAVWVWDLDPGALHTHLCGIANRNLTEDEQRKYLGTGRMAKTCPDLP